MSVVQPKILGLLGFRTNQKFRFRITLNGAHMSWLTGTDLTSNILSHFQSMCQTICPHLCLRKYGIHFLSKKVDPNHGEPLLAPNPASLPTLKSKWKRSGFPWGGSESSVYENQRQGQAEDAHRPRSQHRSKQQQCTAVPGGRAKQFSLSLSVSWFLFYLIHGFNLDILLNL